MAGGELTPKQAMFVREYLVDLNATQAAIRSGYAAKSASVEGTRLLANAKVASEVQKGMDNRADKVELDADNVLKSILDIRRDALADKKYSDALKANELLGKHLKLFTDKVEHIGGLTVVIERIGSQTSE